ncbi:hypothetical protein ACHAPF_003454 [Botrytis cinerea]|uniref:Uncharacterized protein n=1 Tax=Botryotinia fuckeliana (strain T4) TaxID=999810 RepID=G2YKI8_BOTF4|nr:predicted protein [Botrytis cinerea T4]
MPKSLGTDSISDMAKFQECGELEMEIEHKSTTDDTVRWTVNMSFQAILRPGVLIMLIWAV